MRPRHIIIATLLLGGCSIPTLPTLPGLAPYKMDVQQGNVVTQDMIAKVQPGMSRSQVRFALGTPLIVDPFRTDRWDYVYLYRKGGVLTEQRKIAVFFKDDKLVRIDGDVVAAAPAGAAAGKPVGATAAPQVQPEKK